jgi:hypothetical protein
MRGYERGGAKFTYTNVRGYHPPVRGDGRHRRCRALPAAGNDVATAAGRAFNRMRSGGFPKTSNTKP